MGTIIGVVGAMAILILSPKVSKKCGLDNFTCSAIGLLLAVILITAGFYITKQLGVY